jgi:hypothetical protein
MLLYMPEGIWGNGGVIYQILNFGTRRRWVVNFMNQQLYPLGKEPLVPIEDDDGGL